MKIFIAEDDIVTRHLLQTLLSKWGYSISTAEDGTQACAILDAISSPVLVLLDWMMPGVSGVDVCRRLRARVPRHGAYVVMLTALNQPQDIVEGLDAGVDDYLVKPVAPAELRARLQVGSRILNIESDLIQARNDLVVEYKKNHETGLLNRESILQVLQSTLDRNSRDGLPTGIAMLEIDESALRLLDLATREVVFNRTADRIIETASVILENVRPYDIIGRFSTRRFLVIYPGANRTSSMNLSARLLAGVGRSNRLLPARVCIGVSSTDARLDVSADQLVRSAENAVEIARDKAEKGIEYLDDFSAFRPSISSIEALKRFV